MNAKMQKYLMTDPLFHYFTLPQPSPKWRGRNWNPEAKPRGII